MKTVGFVRLVRQSIFSFLLTVVICDSLAAPATTLGYRPKYQPGFKHFNYVNPDAPKGGKLILHGFGNFDSLNPYLLKGVAANGLSFEQALGTITIDAARILGIDKRVGSLEVGKDGDVALYDGDPFEYTTHCIGTVIEGKIVSDTPR